MKTLHLNLKRKWFDMILSGEKKEEYRDISEYWMNYFLQCLTDRKRTSGLMECKISACCLCLTDCSESRFKNFETITFSNGYSKNRRQFQIELEKIEISKGKKRWGAKKNKTYFVLSLGKILSSKNCGLPF